MRRGVRLGSHAAAQAIGRWHSCYYDGPYDDDDDCDEIEEEEEEEESAEDAEDREIAEAEDYWDKRKDDERDREREDKGATA